MHMLGTAHAVRATLKHQCALRQMMHSAHDSTHRWCAVLTTSFGDVHLGLFPSVAPTTVPHIIMLLQSGCYNSNHFFRVDKGFVAQTQDVVSGRLAPLSPMQKEEADKSVPLEVMQGVKHHEGTLSMARHSDPNSGKSSFSILLGDAPHLDMQYTVFGKVTQGMSSIHAMESVETRTEGIFVMPKERITIHSTFVYYVADPQETIATVWSFSAKGMYHNIVADIWLR